MRLAKPAALAIAIVALAAAAPTGALAKKKNPETDSHRTPAQDGGTFLGYPSPTYQWHGCKITSIGQAPWAAPEYVQLNVGRGTKPKAVTFSFNQATPPYITWKVAKGYKICGAQVMTELANPDVDSLLLGSAGYISGKTSGATAKDGKETIKVKIPKGGIGQQFQGYEGKTYGLSEIEAVAVFVKKK